MKQKGFIILFLIFLVWIPSTIFAWSLEFGYKRLMPRLGVSQQTYEDETGQKHDIKPTVEGTALGSSLLLGLKLETYSIELEQSLFEFSSVIDASNSAVSQETPINSTITEQRIALNYHIERELAGLYGGVGISTFEETLESSLETWTFKSYAPFFKFGFDLILDAWIVRYEQVHLEMGDHIVRINSLGVILAF